MDYYEELGLKRTASAQDIRQAYKVMARLVHPDGQANEPVRDMAERQMKRLNEILAILTNEQTRREYDAGLTLAAGPVLRGPQPLQPLATVRLVRRPEWIQPVVENWFWISMAAVLVCVGTWYAAQVRSESVSSSLFAPMRDGKRPLPDEPRPHPRTVGTAASGTAVQAAPQNTTARDHQPATTDRPAVETEQEPAPPPVQASSYSERPLVETRAPAAPRVPPSNLSTARSASSSTPSTAATQLQPSPLTPVAAKPEAEAVNTVPAASVAKPRTSSFAGNWFYVPDPAEKLQPGAYPATYVELLLTDEQSQLRGTYRAQYKVLDRAISPTVSFQVRGNPPPGTSANLKWTSTDGAKGELEMVLTGPDTMKVTWWTTELGRHETLASGTAKLIRQQVR